MKKIVYAIAALAALVSCQSLKEEWQPVFTFGENEPAEMKIWTEADLTKYGFNGTITTINDAKLYNNLVGGTVANLVIREGYGPSETNLI